MSPVAEDTAAHTAALITQLQTENARLKAENERLGRAHAPRTILGLADLVLSVDRQDRITYANSAAERVYGISRTALLGRELRSLPGRPPGTVLADLVAQARAGTGGLERQLTDTEGGRVYAYQIQIHSSGEQTQLLVTDRSELKQLEATFARYLSPTVLEAVLEAGVDPFRARKYELTVVFADLRGFTSMSSQLPAEDVKTLIDEYLTVQIDTVLSAHATLDKIVGDEVMALFGAPLPAEHHAVWAIDTALKMREGHRRLMEIWRRRNLTGCELGIGINSGEMVVGNIGSARRMDFTVLGHNVNLGARLCSAARGGEILLSTRTFELARESLTARPELISRPVKFRRGEAIRAKGLAEPVQTVEVVES